MNLRIIHGFEAEEEVLGGLAQCRPVDGVEIYVLCFDTSILRLVSEKKTYDKTMLV